MNKFIKKGETFVSQNSTVILTSVGVTGTVATAYLTGKASFKAAEILERDSIRRDIVDEPEASFQDRIKLVYPVYIPAAATMVFTIICIIMANRLGTKKAAALAAAYGISERAYQEYKEKVVEKLGENKEQKIRDELAQDRVNSTPMTKEVIIAGAGKVLCFDVTSGRYFESSVEDIKGAQNRINEDIINHMYASLSAFYDEIGLPPVLFAEEVGWNSDALIDVVFSTVMSPDNRPCIALDFVVPPKPNYTQLYG